MTRELRVEASGATEREARAEALRELERLAGRIDPERVRFQVVSEGERGLLGIGSKPAQVVALADVEEPAPPVDESELASEMRALVERVVAALGAGSQVELEEDSESLTVTCSGGSPGILIGKHGQTIDAIQCLANVVAARIGDGAAKQVVVDAAGYRGRRRAALTYIALAAAKRVLASGEPQELEPMSAVERKFVHERLKDYDGVTTTSEGNEPSRRVVVLPAE
ncbi:MAG: RNA-binding cell elongation regulator Jag/EloR [Gaiellaceae bacterium]